MPGRPGLAAACTAVHRPRFDREAHSSRCGVKIAVGNLLRLAPVTQQPPDVTMAQGFGPAPFFCLHRAHGPRGQNRDEGDASARRAPKPTALHQDLCNRCGGHCHNRTYGATGVVRSPLLALPDERRHGKTDPTAFADVRGCLPIAVARERVVRTDLRSGSGLLGVKMRHPGASIICLQSTVAGGAALVERRFRDGICAGDIPPDFPVAERAIQVTDFARGLTMRAQIGTPRKTLLWDAEEATDLVLLSRHGNAAPER